jgi:predicted amidohydrolase
MPTLPDVRIAALQHDIVWCDRDANAARLAPQIRSAAASDARLILLTETFSTGFAVGEADLAERFDGPSSTFLRAQAAEHDVWIGGTCPELADGAPDGARPYNVFVLAGPDGSVHRYRKIHPFTYGGEHEHFDAGDAFVTVTVDDLRVTLFTCYDLRFADEFWQRALDTVVYLVPANWPAARRIHWMALLQARAIENQAYVVGCNRVGMGGGLEYSGDSRIVDPLGELLATASMGESMLIADVSAQRVAEVRERYRFLQDRR